MQNQIGGGQKIDIGGGKGVMDGPQELWHHEGPCAHAS